MVGLENLCARSASSSIAFDHLSIQSLPSASLASGSIAVVGAGWAGLSAGYRLAQLGYSVDLYDAAPQAGGRARGLTLSFLGRDRQLDNGQHLLIGAYTETLALLSQALRSTSTSTQVTDSNQRTSFTANHQLSPFLLRQASCPLPRENSREPTPGLNFGRKPRADESIWLSWIPQVGTALGLILARGLSFSDKVAFIRFIETLKRKRFQGFEGQTVLYLLRATKQPAGLISRVWDPLCVSALNTAIDSACAQTFANVIQDSLVAKPYRAPDSSSTKLVFPSDYILPNQDLTQYFVVPVLKGFQELGGRVHLRHTVRDLDELRANHLVLAVPPHGAAMMLGEAQSGLATQLDQFEYQSITTVYLAWDRRLPSLEGGPMLLQEEPTQEAYGQWLFDRGFHNEIHVAAVVVSARGRYASLDVEPLSANIAKQVQRQTGLPLAQQWRAITEKRATFSCTPDRPKLSESDLSFTLSYKASTRIYLAGDYCYSRYPATLESAVRSGLAAAQRIHLAAKV
jgi:hydroxysqualene dehydroxylase